MNFPRMRTPSTAPATVPRAPIRKMPSIRPVSFQIFDRFTCRSSSGIAIGTAKPQTTSSKIGALAGMIFRFVSSSAQIRAMMAPLILLAHA